MSDESHAPCGEISGDEVHSYISRYAEKWDLHHRTRFNTIAASISRRANPNGWIVFSDKGEAFECEKLIVATGTFTIPHIPNEPRISRNFKGPVFHTRR